MSSIFNEKLIFPQENGKDVELLVNGDEFYSRYETIDGYTAIYDSDIGEFCFAEKVHGCLVSSRITIDRKPPKRIKRHLRENSDIRRKKFDSRFTLMQPELSPVLPFDTLRTFGPNNGLLNGRRVSMGKVIGLTIIVEFADVKSAVTKADVESMLNDDSYSSHGNHCSVREYFSNMSNGELDYANDVLGPITLPKNRQFYVNRPFFADVLNEIVAQGIELSRYDSLGEGVIDAISFMYAGRTLYQGWLWPHNHTLDWSSNGYSSNFYQISSLGLDTDGLSIGTFCHESGHMLCRFPDLYDYGKRDGDFQKSAGMGRYCLMSSGNHLDSGKTPSSISAYLRDLAGWPKRVKVNSPKKYEIEHGDYSSVYIYETDELNEYYLIENRHTKGLDSHLPSSGIAVYHCDTLGSNEHQGGTPTAHYQCGLLQADGHLDLERNQNTGDSGDFFDDVQGIALSHDSVPSTLLWDGSDSGLSIKNISKSEEKMTFEVVEN
ncbi:M6 family metalloprotease domain-containing protein [Desulfogranum marinum]|uniref:M6 family metalloprotease domain-containing protein n=1 Tax=Desulfogranum marinum TaxID=453220 RepID=UPI0029C6FFFE|nr:M6 family metalloprotease domain-containing protein [Desulfogranum marinum]